MTTPTTVRIHGLDPVPCELRPHFIIQRGKRVRVANTFAVAICTEAAVIAVCHALSSNSHVQVRRPWGSSGWMEMPLRIQHDYMVVTIDEAKVVEP